MSSTKLAFKDFSTFKVIEHEIRYSEALQKFVCKEQNSNRITCTDKSDTGCFLKALKTFKDLDTEKVHHFVRFPRGDVQ